MTTETAIMKRVYSLLTPEWRSALDLQFEDMTFRLVLADWLQEQGKFKEEESLRWSVKLERCPKADWTPGYWYFEREYQRGNTEERLPLLLGERVAQMYAATGAELEYRCPSTVFSFLMLAWADSTDLQRVEYWKWSQTGD